MNVILYIAKTFIIQIDMLIRNYIYTNVISIGFQMMWKYMIYNTINITRNQNVLKSFYDIS